MGQAKPLIVEELSKKKEPSSLREDRLLKTCGRGPGDIIVLGEGDSVSADGRLFTAASLRIAEASLTGESVYFK